ncbi:MAG TPA: MBL fold metallo-hydrolase [Clostridia bacterium]|nr:MBL fold metallo-hydrolase [Clostridia bacterium]
MTDEDTGSESLPATPVVTVPPERQPDVSAQPLDALLAEQDFAILFVNVGKADAAILRFGETAVLIDTGSAESAPQLIAGLNALGVANISAVFITHSHSDHLGGLDALSANYGIPMVYSPFYSEQDKNGTGKIVKRAEKLSLPHQELMAGDVVTIADGVSFRVLGPLSLNEEDDNDNSLVLRLDYGGKSFLFVGDMQFAEEQEIIVSGVPLASDVLKVGNHGNPDATGDDFGALVSPAYAIISTNTLVDTDSANPRVYAALPTTEIVVTEDFPLGVLLTLDDSGAITLQNPARNPIASAVTVERFDVDAQTITLRNSGESAADLSGMILFSVRSDVTLRFPEGTVLQAGEQLTVGNGGDFTFVDEDKPLSKKKDNTVVLYDRLGTLVSKLEQ